MVHSSDGLVVANIKRGKAVGKMEKAKCKMQNVDDKRQGGNRELKFVQQKFGCRGVL